MFGRFRDHQSGQMSIFTIQTAEYVESKKYGIFLTTDDDDIIVPMSSAEWNNIIDMLYKEGKVDLSAYPAYINESLDVEASETDDEIESKHNGNIGAFISILVAIGLTVFLILMVK